MLKNWKEYIPLSIISFLYILLLTWKIPFFGMDYMNIPVFSKAWDYQLLNYGFEFYFRPVENAVYYVFLHLFGIEPLPFRIFKALMIVGVVCFIYYFVKKTTENKKIACLASIFFLLTSTVLQSVMFIYDFEIVAQFFMLAGAYYFFKIYEAEKPVWRDILLFCICLYLALLTKESTKIFIGVLAGYSISSALWNQTWKKEKYLILPILFLLFTAMNPGILLGLKGHSSGTVLHSLFNWFSPYNIIFFLKYFVLSTFSIIFILGLLTYEARKYKLIQEYFGISIPIFFGIWFLITSILTLIVPMADTRYAIVPLLPFIISSFMLIGIFYKKYRPVNKHIFFLAIILVIVNIGINLAMSLKYSYGFGNYITLVEESYRWTESKYNESIFFYTDSTAHFFGKYNNLYLEYSYINDSITLPLFFFALQSPLKTKEKNTSQLITTFIKGPQCFMLYAQGNQTTTFASLITYSENKFIYIFPNETELEYCTIELSARFLLSQKITLTLVGDTENATHVLSPPVGKYKYCEYQCPKFINNETKITAIEVTGSDSFLTKIYGGTVHYIEKI